MRRCLNAFFVFEVNSLSTPMVNFLASPVSQVRICLLATPWSIATIGNGRRRHV